MAKKITIDPVTRIEGHLRIDCEVDNGKVTNAWSSGQMWRGIEVILKGRDPRDAWAYTQRICGVCTTVHAIASVRAVEDALKMEIPLNAQYIRNMVIGAHGIHDHMVHFYHLCALDWVDIVSATTADVQATAALGQKLSDWKGNSPQEIKAVQDRLKKFIASGQLGIFASGYWGHPAMKLSPEVNLLAATHYLQALEYQRKINQAVAILGSKTPHVQNLVVGGVSNPINPDSPANLTVQKLYQIKTLIDGWATSSTRPCHRRGCHRRLLRRLDGLRRRCAQLPVRAGHAHGHQGHRLRPARRLHPGRRYRQVRAHRQSAGKTLYDGIKESIKHTWYNGAWDRSPYEEDTVPEYTGYDYDKKYSWVKAPTYLGQPAQVDPLPHVVAMYLAGHETTRKYVDSTLATVSAWPGPR